MITVKRTSNDRYASYPTIEANHGVSIRALFTQFQDSLGLDDNMSASVNEVSRSFDYIPQNGDVVVFRESMKDRG